MMAKINASYTAVGAHQPVLLLMERFNQSSKSNNDLYTGVGSVSRPNRYSHCLEDAVGNESPWDLYGNTIAVIIHVL